MVKQDYKLITPYPLGSRRRQDNPYGPDQSGLIPALASVGFHSGHILRLLYDLPEGWDQSNTVSTTFRAHIPRDYQLTSVCSEIAPYEFQTKIGDLIIDGEVATGIKLLTIDTGDASKQWGGLTFNSHISEDFAQAGRLVAAEALRRSGLRFFSSYGDHPTLIWLGIDASADPIEFIKNYQGGGNIGKILGQKNHKFIGPDRDNNFGRDFFCLPPSSQSCSAGQQKDREDFAS